MNNFQQLTATPDAFAVVRTPDCVQEYYRLAASGMKPASGLEYTPEGLSFRVTDQLGNTYRVIESRNYQEAD